MIRNTPLKAGRKKGPTAVEKRHHDRVAQMGCCVCGREATIHHVTGTIYGPIPLEAGTRRSERRVVALCPIHHQKVHDPRAADPQSVEGLSHAGFYDKFGIDLFTLANDLWAESEQERRAA